MNRTFPFFASVTKNVIYKIQDRKQRYPPHCFSDQGLTGTVVNWAFISVDGGSLKITLTVPFIELVKIYSLDGAGGTSINL